MYSSGFGSGDPPFPDVAGAGAPIWFLETTVDLFREWYNISKEKKERQERWLEDRKNGYTSPVEPPVVKNCWLQQGDDWVFRDEAFLDSELNVSIRTEDIKSHLGRDQKRVTVEVHSMYPTYHKYHPVRKSVELKPENADENAIKLYNLLTNVCMEACEERFWTNPSMYGDFHFYKDAKEKFDLRLGYMKYFDYVLSRAIADVTGIEPKVKIRNTKTSAMISPGTVSHQFSI